MRFDEKGREVLDATPVEMPAGFRRPESLASMMARMVAGELSRRAAAQGAETFAEANDFDVDEDDVTHIPSRYELAAMVPDTAWIKGEGNDADDTEEPARDSRGRKGAGSVGKEPDRDDGDGDTGGGEGDAGDAVDHDTPPREGRNREADKGSAVDRKGTGGAKAR